MDIHTYITEDEMQFVDHEGHVGFGEQDERWREGWGRERQGREGRGREGRGEAQQRGQRGRWGGSRSVLSVAPMDWVTAGLGKGGGGEGGGGQRALELPLSAEIVRLILGNARQAAEEEKESVQALEDDPVGGIGQGGGLGHGGARVVGGAVSSGGWSRLEARGGGRGAGRGRESGVGGREEGLRDGRIASAGAGVDGVEWGSDKGPARGREGSCDAFRSAFVTPRFFFLCGFFVALRACVLVCVHACTRWCVLMCVCVCVCMSACVHA
jgi:hypothetical protein